MMLGPKAVLVAMLLALCAIAARKWGMLGG
jgi:hypothetical protein